MPSQMLEPQRRLDVCADVDVAVIGGGIAGVAAAIAAARQGASVCLVEKEYALGGLATLGIVTVYLPLCDGRGNQVVGGLGEELLLCSAADGSADVPDCWKPGGDPDQRLHHRYRVTFNPASYMIALERLIVDAGATLLYDTRFCAVIRRGRRIQAVLVENKAGRSAIACRAVVDASGDADVCAAAGEPTVSLKTNVAGGWFYTLDEVGHTGMVKFSLPFDLDGLTIPAAGGCGFAGDDPDDVTRQVLDTRRAIGKRIAELRADRGGEKLWPLMVPTFPTFRMTRRLKKRLELHRRDDRRYFDDAIGMLGSWLNDGLLFYLPLSSLTAERTDNLLVAGRCIAVHETGWCYTRAIPGCAVTGEAAGVAAALAAREHEGSVPALDVRRLQRELVARGVILDRSFARDAAE